MTRSKELDFKRGETLICDNSIVGGPHVNSLLNPDGSPRGGISTFAKVADTAFVDITATVLAGAEIVGNASVRGASIIGAGVFMSEQAKVVNSHITPMTATSVDSRVSICGNALVENFNIYGISVEIFGDAWISGRYEADMRNATGKHTRVEGGYFPDELIDGASYGGHQEGTTKANLLSDDGVTALKNWLLSLPPSVRSQHVEELAALLKRVGGKVDISPVEAPVYRFVHTLEGEYVVPLSKNDMLRVEDLLKSGASFHDIASLYEVDDDALFVALEKHVGYNPFALWDKFVQRPMRCQYSIHIPSEKGFLFAQWCAINPEEHHVWETERRSVEGGLLYEFDSLPVVHHASILDRPDNLKWQTPSGDFQNSQKHQNTPSSSPSSGVVTSGKVSVHPHQNARSSNLMTGDHAQNLTHGNAAQGAVSGSEQNSTDNKYFFVPDEPRHLS